VFGPYLLLSARGRFLSSPSSVARRGRDSPTATDLLQLPVLPADEATWAHLQAVFGMRGRPASCRCQGFELGRHDVHDTMPVEERIERQRFQTACDRIGF
jgi:hypothetical protein